MLGLLFTVEYQIIYHSSIKKNVFSFIFSIQKEIETSHTIPKAVRQLRNPVFWL